MEITKVLVEELNSNYLASMPDGTIIVPIYDVKTVDIKRNNFVMVYTVRRNIMLGGIGGRVPYEDVDIKIDVRTSSYDTYDSIKYVLKKAIMDWSRGIDKEHIYNVILKKEDELSNKARGLYRFVLGLIVYRYMDCGEYTQYFYDYFDDGLSLISIPNGVVVEKSGLKHYLKNVGSGKAYMDIPYNTYMCRGLEINGDDVGIEIYDGTNTVLSVYMSDGNYNINSGEKSGSVNNSVKILSGKGDFTVYVDGENVYETNLSGDLIFRIGLNVGGELNWYKGYKRWC